MIQKQLQKVIRKITGTLKSGEELNQVLKVRLTKREYKMLNGWAEGLLVEDISSKLRLDTQGYQELSEKLVKKLNQEKLKQELVDY